MSFEFDLPPKSVFKADELCNLVDIRPYVLRFWENEFKEIMPITSSSGQKLYEEKDVKAVRVVKDLLFNICSSIHVFCYPSKIERLYERLR